MENKNVLSLRHPTVDREYQKGLWIVAKAELR